MVVRTAIIEIDQKMVNFDDVPTKSNTYALRKAPITNFDHESIDLSEKESLFDNPKSGEQVLLEMAAGHVAKPKIHPPEGPTH